VWCGARVRKWTFCGRKCELLRIKPSPQTHYNRAFMRSHAQSASLLRVRARASTGGYGVTSCLYPGDRGWKKPINLQMFLFFSLGIAAFSLMTSHTWVLGGNAFGHDEIEQKLGLFSSCGPPRTLQLCSLHLWLFLSRIRAKIYLQWSVCVPWKLKLKRL